MLFESYQKSARMRGSGFPQRIKDVSIMLYNVVIILNVNN